MEIEHLKYKEIDFEKYDACIKNAINTRVYAYSWYLDVVCNKDWEVLILDNYKAVMPLPFKRIKRKFLKRMIEQPMFCQQLGVFYPSKISEIKFELFINKVATLNYNTYNFNADNSDFLVNRNHYNERVNYELNLNNTYEEIQSNYSKNLKRNIKKGVKNELIITSNVTINDFILMKKENKKHKIKKKLYDLISKLILKIETEGLGKFYGVSKENNLIAIAFIIQTNNRFIHLFSVSTLIGKKFGAIPFLFNEIIKNNADKNSIFDFEGSMITGVASFFKSFNSENNAYYNYTNN